ncbi:MAG: hypothetical protein ACJ0Q3_10365 [Candidatus Azotimanducaceae bacterium]
MTGAPASVTLTRAALTLSEWLAYRAQIQLGIEARYWITVMVAGL